MEALTQKEFVLLVIHTERAGPLSQRQLAAASGYSLGTVNKLVRRLTDRGLLADGRITREGQNSLEKYRARRAIFVAAGFGARLAPVTLKTPKPLVAVRGQRIIDGLLDAVLAAGIEDIVIVRGYKAEQFDVLKEKYPMIRFVENPAYAEANNILSALCVKDEIQNAYMFDADLLIRNPRIITRYHYTSDFLGVPTARTDDWFFEVKNGVILGEKLGGLNGYTVVGISYWNGEDGKRLAEDLERAVKLPAGKEYYWEQVPMAVYKNDYRVAIRPCTAEDITEIDNYSELVALDPSYAEN